MIVPTLPSIERDAIENANELTENYKNKGYGYYFTYSNSWEIYIEYFAITNDFICY